VVVLQDGRFDNTASITVCPLTTNLTDVPLLRPAIPQHGIFIRASAAPSTLTPRGSRTSGRLRFLSGGLPGRRGARELALRLQPVVEIVAVLLAAGEEQLERPPGNRFGDRISTRLRITTTSRRHLLDSPVGDVA
jgi:hypothetical protein